MGEYGVCERGRQTTLQIDERGRSLARSVGIEVIREPFPPHIHRRRSRCLCHHRLCFSCCCCCCCSCQHCIKPRGQESTRAGGELAGGVRQSLHPAPQPKDLNRTESCLFAPCRSLIPFLPLTDPPSPFSPQLPVLSRVPFELVWLLKGMLAGGVYGERACGAGHLSLHK